MKKNLRVVKPLIALFIFISIIAFSTTVNACGSDRIFVMAKGEDIDLQGFNNLIIGNIKGNKGGVIFHSKFHDESGKYAMSGSLTKGSLKTTEHMFYCPVYNVWWINVWWLEAEGKFKTTDTELVVFFRNFMYITMPNTNGKWISASIFMWLTFTDEYYPAEFDEEGNLLPPPLGTVPLIWEGERWVLAGVFWDTGIPELNVGYGAGILPIGPVSSITRYIEK